jgi:hypothetical protein
MKVSVGRILSVLSKAIAVMAISFACTLFVIHPHWISGTEVHVPIHVVEATYGGNCQSFFTSVQHPNVVRLGNATEAVSAACDGVKSTCLFRIDTLVLGDPAVGCGKEFTVTWQCGNDQKNHAAYFPAEADRRIALLSCQRW